MSHHSDIEAYVKEKQIFQVEKWTSLENPLLNVDPSLISSLTSDVLKEGMQVEATAKEEVDNDVEETSDHSLEEGTGHDFEEASNDSLEEETDNDVEETSQTVVEEKTTKNSEKNPSNFSYSGRGSSASSPLLFKEANQATPKPPSLLDPYKLLDYLKNFSEKQFPEGATKSSSNHQLTK